MKIFKKSFAGRLWLAGGVVFALLLAGSVVQSEAQIYTLSARDTSVQINLTNGVSDWTIDGVNQLNQQWFYYSVGSGPVYSIDQIAPWTTPSISTNGPKTVITLNETYASPTISVGTQFQLQSQPLGSGQAKLAQTLTINNPTATQQTYHFYQYSDFDLGGVLGNQNVVFSANGSGQYYQVVQTGLTGSTLNGLISGVSGGISVQYEVEAGTYDGTQFGLTNGNPSAPTLDGKLTAGPGDVVYAYEWDVTLSPGGAVIISELQSVPEPSSVALISSGTLVLVLLRRRHRTG